MQPAFAEFLTAILIMELTPGPNMTWLALLAAQRGRMIGIQAVAGITAGLTTLAVLAATGAAALISTYPALYEVLRWGGVLFLLYLAWEAWVGEKPGAARDDQGRHFRRGFVVNMLNPKAAAIFLLMIPSFASESDPGNPPIILMTAIYLAIATAVHALIVVFAGAFTRLATDPRREVAIRRVFALMLAAIAIWFALTTGQPRP